MATLDAFLIRGKKKTPSLLSSSQDPHIQHAFVNPFTVQVKKPSVPLGNKAPTEKPTKHQSKKNTIAHYFTPAIQDTADVDVDMQDATDVCVIRNKIPVANLWDMIQYELDQDPFYNDIMDESSATIATTTTLAVSSNCIKRRRSRQSDTEQNSKRLRKTDQELSSIMARFLNMGSMIKERPMLSSLDLMNEFSEDMEDLSRPVRHKQTSQESHLFLYHITQEFLDFAINQ
ncbi:hypothetical protein MAM1_0023c01965 [Mucor ambiguus]|uniref:Uncharacterized protein n=1 Tax=Mucor ambiguus TaxID=91626 RepID=A0A0C9M1W3_9FUNG|nr:hypothetical protein MAM1_0023c01965 [Mucor ambiguus]